MRDLKGLHSVHSQICFDSLEDWIVYFKQNIHLYFTAVFSIIRNQGTFGNVTVFWAIHPVSTKDIFPEQGTVFFGNEEFLKNITVYSLPDEVNIFMQMISEVDGLVGLLFITKEKGYHSIVGYHSKFF